MEQEGGGRRTSADIGMVLSTKSIIFVWMAVVNSAGKEIRSIKAVPFWEAAPFKAHIVPI